MFGTAGVPHSARGHSAAAGIEQAARLGLECMEVEFVHGVKMSDAAAAEARRAAARHRIVLSAHAPYYINLNAGEKDKLEASQARLLRTARIAERLGARNVVFHPGFYLGDPPDQVYRRVRDRIRSIRAILDEEGNSVVLRPELMGRTSQFGSLDETLSLCQEMDGVAPCLDFSHWHARTGGASSLEDFLAVLDRVDRELGRSALEDIHIHVSGVQYGRSGETRHVTLEESDLRYEALLIALKERGARGMVICESPNLEEDALLLQRTYLGLPSGGP